MSKIFNNFLIGLLFVLGIILIPTYKVDAAITVTVKVDGVAANKIVPKNSNVQISWISTGATSCSEGGGRGGTGTTGSFPVNSIQATETFTVTCTTPAYCSGTTNVPLCAGTVIGGTYSGKSCNYYFWEPYIRIGQPSAIQAACGPNADHTGCTYIPSITYPCSNFTNASVSSPSDLCGRYSGCTWIP